MKIVVAAGGRFHAIRLAQELHARDALYRFISGSYTSADHRYVPSSLVNSIKSIQIIDQIIWRTRLASFIRPSTLYVAKDNWFDKRLKVALQQLEPFDIFVGWAHYFLGSMTQIRDKAKIVIVESGSCHIEEHEQLIVDECRKLNLPTNHLHPANRNKILAEYEASDYIMTPSSFARNSFLRKGFSSERILQIPCGMDLDFFADNSSIKRPDNFFRVLFVGQLQIGKGIHTLIEAWRRLGLDATKAELLLVGNMQKDVRLLLERSSLPAGIRIISGVSRTELKKLYAQSHAFVLPSLQDGFGMVIGEAMASGLPVIASMNTGAPDIIQSSEEGLLVPAGNIDALTDALLKLYGNKELRNTIGKAGRERIQDFTWQHYGNTTIAHYKELLQNYENQQKSRTAGWQTKY